MICIDCDHGISKCTRLSEISPPVFDAITNQPGLYPCLVISNLDFDKCRKKKEEKEEEEEKKCGNSKPRHFPKEMAEAKRKLVRTLIIGLFQVCPCSLAGTPIRGSMQHNTRDDWGKLRARQDRLPFIIVYSSIVENIIMYSSSNIIQKSFGNDPW